MKDNTRNIELSNTNETDDIIVENENYYNLNKTKTRERTNNKEKELKQDK